MGLLVRLVLALAMVAPVLGITSCGRSDANGTVVRITAMEAVKVIAQGEDTVVDLRSPGDFAAGHVAGAVNINASAPGFGDRVAKLDESATYLVYARTKADSARAADRMAELGIDRILDAGSFGLLALAGADLEG